MAKKWAAAEWIVILAFVLLFLVFLYTKGGIEPFFQIINGYYGILLVLLVFLYYKIGLWSAVPLYVVAVASLAQGVFNNPDGELVMERLKSLLVGFHPDPYWNAYNSGVREVIELIERQCDDTEYQKYLEKIKNASDKKE